MDEFFVMADFLESYSFWPLFSFLPTICPMIASMAPPKSALAPVF